MPNHMTIFKTFVCLFVWKFVKKGSETAQQILMKILGIEHLIKFFMCNSI